MFKGGLNQVRKETILGRSMKTGSRRNGEKVLAWKYDEKSNKTNQKEKICKKNERKKQALEHKQKKSMTWEHEQKES